MPTLSRFYGLRVHIHSNDHPPPHVHVDHAEHRASVSLDTLEILAGRLPRRARVLFLEWAVLHRVELLAAWNAVAAREDPGTIEPLV